MEGMSASQWSTLPLVPEKFTDSELKRASRSREPGRASRVLHPLQPRSAPEQTAPRRRHLVPPSPHLAPQPRDLTPRGDISCPINEESR